MARLLTKGGYGRILHTRVSPVTGTFKQHAAALSTTADTPSSTPIEAPPPSDIPNSRPIDLVPPSDTFNSGPSESNTPIIRTIPKPSPPSRKPNTRPTKNLNSEGYTVGRTPSNNLSVYQTDKRGGNLHITTVKKVSGNAEMLRKQIEEFVTPRPEYVSINSVTGHVFMKGRYKTQIENFLTLKGF